jgi:hypothetical protein
MGMPKGLGAIEHADLFDCHPSGYKMLTDSGFQMLPIGCQMARSAT